MEQHDYIVLLEKFFKKEASSEERRILIEWIRKPGIRNEFNLLCVIRLTSWFNSLG